MNWTVTAMSSASAGSMARLYFVAFMVTSTSGTAMLVCLFVHFATAAMLFLS